MKTLLDGMGLAVTALQDFSYPCFKKLYEAPLQGTIPEEEQVQREVGVDLNKHGGMACMYLHYYMVNYAMCGGYFFGQVERPMSVMCYINAVQHVWSGRGEWVA